jgi:hypothetical protein
VLENLSDHVALAALDEGDDAHLTDVSTAMTVNGASSRTTSVMAICLDVMVIPYRLPLDFNAGEEEEKS